MKIQPSTHHQSVLTPTKIEGATLMQVPSISYEYGVLSEIYHTDWDTYYTEPIEHMYVINNHRNHREHWHVHHKTFDRYVLIVGEIEVALLDNRVNSNTKDTLERFTLRQVGMPGYHGLKIPPGVLHTFRSASESFILLNNKYPKYNRDDPDKYVYPLDTEGMRFSW